MFVAVFVVADAQYPFLQQPGKLKIDLMSYFFAKSLINSIFPGLLYPGQFPQPLQPSLGTGGENKEAICGLKSFAEIKCSSGSRYDEFIIRTLCFKLQ